MSKITLSKPFEADGKTYTEFNLDYDNATGNIVIQAEKMARKTFGLTDMFLPTSQTYRLIFASLLLKIPVVMLQNLPLRDVQEITDDVMNFFGSSVSDGMTATATDKENTSTPETES